MGSAEIQLKEKSSLLSRNVCTSLRESASQVKRCISRQSLQTHKIAGMNIAEKPRTATQEPDQTSGNKEVYTLQAHSCSK
jgi:hypothetical protein